MAAFERLPRLERQRTEGATEGAGDMAQTSTWKHTERRIAKALGGRRNGNRGSATADVQGDWYVAEVKHRKRLPPLLHSAMRQAVAAAQPGQLPLVVLHETNKAGDDDYVVVRLSDFVEWFGDVDETP